jgi:hypothetical protein
MSEETTTPTEETPSEPTVFNYVAGARQGASNQRTGPVELVYTPDGWVIKE